MADVSFTTATAAYAKGLADAASARAVAPDQAASAAPGSGASFTDFVSDALAAARETGLEAERAATRAVAGEVSLQEVVTSITNAEVTLQTVVALRDRVISAYNDILRMPI